MITIDVSFRSISFAAENEDDDVDVWGVEGDAGSVADPDSLEIWPSQHSGDFLAGLTAPHIDGYDFAFWTASDGTIAQPNFPAFTATCPTVPSGPALPDGSHLQIIGWYGPTGGPVNDPVLFRARTFDLDLNAFRKETPVAAVAPPAAWGGPNSHVVSSRPATMSPKVSLVYPAPQANQSGARPKYYKTWHPVFGSLVQLAGSIDVVWANEPTPPPIGALAVFFYAQRFSPRPGVVKVSPDRYLAWLTAWLDYLGRHGGDPSRALELLRQALQHR